MAEGRQPRVESAFDDLSEAIQAMRIEIAQRRDDLLTRNEQIAMLEVYEEFGR